jgi:2-oxoglutarate ferredoxin oxidoreductase subunit alpha
VTLERIDQNTTALVEDKLNNFSIVIATANGTGSQTANLTLLRALFKMGLPVGGKNVFPSNIQGLPTWYHIRVNEQGFVGYNPQPQILVAFNEETAREDMTGLSPGNVCVYPSDWRNVSLRDDLVNYGMPVNQFLKEAGIRGKIRDYMANMVYLGVLAQLLGIPQDTIQEALDYQFGGRKKLVDSNMVIFASAYEWTADNLEKCDPFRVEPRNLTADQLLITGNEAAALGSVFGGVTLASWYPITPSTSLVEALNDFLSEMRRDPDSGEATYAVIQAEDEIAAAGMVMGAGFAGARAMTATSGPGISLMSEFAGLGYFAEIPSVIWDVQRVGPSTGLPTRTSQGDVLFAYYLGHGDTKNVLLFPANMTECFDFGVLAFDLAEQIQTPVFVLSDLDLGMNTWMTPPFEYPTEPMKRGKVLTAADVEEKGFHRYVDVDGDGITYRTLPGNSHPLAAYFNRGTGHNRFAVYSEKADDWEENMSRLNQKFESARQFMPAAIVDYDLENEVAIIAYGSTLPAIEEARYQLAAEGMHLNFLRIRALPINDTIKDFVARHQRVYVVELNRDGQMHQILASEMPELATRLISLAHLDGMPLDANWLITKFKAVESRNLQSATHYQG